MNRVTKLIIVMVSLILLSSCMSDSIFLIDDSTNISCTNCSTLWEINETSGELQPINFSDNRTVRVFDIIVESANSIVLGGFINGTEPFAKISVEESLIESGNVSVRQIEISKGILITDSINGFTLLSNTNFNQGSDALAVTSSGGFEGNGMTLFKRNKNYKEPYLGQVVNLNGDMDLINSKSNDGSSFGDNEIRIGYYDDIFVVSDTVNLSLLNKSFIMIMNTSIIRTLIPSLFEDNVFFETTTYFNESFIAGSPATRTSPTPLGNQLALFARDDGNLYIKRSNGNVRRITTANSGSNIWTEEQIFNNHTTFLGDVILNNTVYNGGYVGYACIDATGHLFKSATPCHLTSDTYTTSTIANVSLGDETDI